MQIIGAFFIDTIELRQVPGPSTRIDVGGIHFSLAAPSPVPVSVEPHLLVLVHCPEGEPGNAALEVAYFRGDEQVARNVQPLQVEPGKFNYRLVRAELTFEEYGTVDTLAVYAAATDLTDDDIVLGEGRQIVFVEPAAARALDLGTSAAGVVPAFLDSELYRSLAG